jgi:hypothetical protein
MNLLLWLWEGDWPRRNCVHCSEMNPVSKLRFNSLAGYSRSPMVPLLVHELEWFEAGSEKVLGELALDLSDDDYVCYVFGRDALGRFRAVWLDHSIPTADEARARLNTKITEFAKMPPEQFHQGDEVGKPMDFFTPVVKPEALNPDFTALVSQSGYSPARGLMSEMMHYFKDPDGNFVQQFQTTAFSPRFWELYLYALFTELGYGFNREYQMPDFHCQGLLGDFFVEAATVNPSDSVPKIDASNEKAYFESYVPIKFGSVLFSKLEKQYWKCRHVAGHPLVFAIQDFHTPLSMSWSSSALPEYLYGIRQIDRKKPDGAIEIVSEKVESYIWSDGQKTKTIPSNFFSQPGTEHVSAVLANPEGTISKFNRMGFLAGFGDRTLKMTRTGLCYFDSVIPSKFEVQVHAPGYAESWSEGVSVYHNPNAKEPLPPEAMPGVAHHFSKEGRIVAQKPKFHTFGSITMIVR